MFSGRGFADPTVIEFATIAVPSEIVLTPVSNETVAPVAPAVDNSVPKSPATSAPVEDVTADRKRALSHSSESGGNKAPETKKQKRFSFF